MSRHTHFVMNAELTGVSTRTPCGYNPRVNATSSRVLWLTGGPAYVTCPTCLSVFGAARAAR